MSRVAIRAVLTSALPTVSTALYTVPAASKLELVDLEVSGPAALAANVTVGVQTGAVGAFIINDALTRGARIQWRGFVVLNAGDVIVGSSTVPGTTLLATAILVQ